MYEFFNPNPRRRQAVGDCTIRAISKALDVSWDTAYIDLVIQGYLLADMPSSNSVFSAYLKTHGFSKHAIDDTCPDCYTVRDFVRDHPKGTYILGTGTHMVAAEDGKYFDSWDSGDEVPLFYYKKEHDLW